MNCSRSACSVLCCSSYAANLACSISVTGEQRERERDKSESDDGESDDGESDASDEGASQSGPLLTVLCLELIVLLQSAKVFFSLLLQRCDTTLQRNEVEVGISCLGKVERPTISLELHLLKVAAR